MSASKKVVGLISILLTAGIFWYLNQKDTEPPSTQNAALTHVIDECDAITEKAAANLVAVVETQRLEIAGRKAHVFKLCMADRGYIENPVWTKFAEPIASKKAASEHISIDEAFENLRRSKMKQITQNSDEPVFWALKNTS